MKFSVRAGVLAAAVLAASVAVAPVSAAQPTPAPMVSHDACPGACTMIYDPVVCQMSDGTTQEFGNECQARVYACQHGVRVVSCAAKAS